MEEQININDILSLFARRWWVILLCGLIVGAVTFSFTYFLVAPVYTSSGTLYVNNVKDKNAINLTQNDIMLSQKLVNTYAEILNSETFRQNISRKLDSEVTSSQLKKMIKMSGVGETEILKVSASSTDPEMARKVVQAILVSAPEEIVRVVKAGSVEIIDNANVPTIPSSPNIQLNTIIGILAGILLSILIIFIIEFFDTTVKDEADLTNKYALPVLGVIPNLRDVYKRQVPTRACLNRTSW